MPEPQKRKRRWLQYSLRSLLAFTMVCAITFGWLGKKIERKREERDAVDAIRKIGGGVRYDYQIADGVKHEPFGPRWLRAILGEDFFSEVTVVDGPQRQVKLDALLESLKDFPKLDALTLNRTATTDAELSNVCEFEAAHDP
jgi:hypothetical protein